MRKFVFGMLATVAILAGTTAVRWMLLPLAVRAQTNTFCANNLACTVTGAWNYTGGLQINGINAADVSSSQGISNKTLTSTTFDISLNTLKTATNTAGHYPRNNGTQYVDASIAGADVPATTSNCSGVQFAQGLNAGMTPVCTTPPTFVASGASHAVGYVPDPGSSAGTTRFLREDATWVTPAAGATTLNKQDPTGTTTGNGTAQTVYTYSMPGGTLASGKCLDIYFAAKSSATTGTMAVTFGGTTVGTASVTGVAAQIMQVKICNNNSSTTAQWATNTYLDTGIVVNSSAVEAGVATASINTGNAVTITGTYNIASPNTWTGQGWTVITEP